MDTRSAERIDAAKKAMKRWKNCQLDINDAHVVNAYLTLSKSTDRVTLGKIAAFLGSAKTVHSKGAGSKMSFWAVTKANFPKGPGDKWKKFVLSAAQLEKYDMAEVDCDFESVWVVDKAASRGDLGMEVLEVFFTKRKDLAMKEPKGDSEEILPGFVDFRPVRQNDSDAEQPAASSHEKALGGRPAPGVEGAPGTEAETPGEGNAGGRKVPEAEVSTPQAKGGDVGGSGAPGESVGGRVAPSGRATSSRHLGAQGSDESTGQQRAKEPLYVRMKNNIKEAVRVGNFVSDDPNDAQSVKSWSDKVITGLTAPATAPDMEPLRQNFGRFLIKVLLDNPCADSLGYFQGILESFPQARVETVPVYPLLVRAAKMQNGTGNESLDFTGVSLDAVDRLVNSTLWADFQRSRNEKLVQLAKTTRSKTERDAALTALRKARGLSASLSSEVSIAYSLLHSSIAPALRYTSAMTDR